MTVIPCARVEIICMKHQCSQPRGPLDIRLGNEILTWRENLVCAEAVTLDRLQQPNSFNCLASGGLGVRDDVLHLSGCVEHGRSPCMYLQFCAGCLELTASPAASGACSVAGRYLWLVLRVSGTMVAPLSVCEVEVTPKAGCGRRCSIKPKWLASLCGLKIRILCAQGPSGNRHILQTAGGMWPLQLQGI